MPHGNGSDNSLPNCWELRNCGREEGGSRAESHGVCVAYSEGMGHSCWANAGFLGDCGQASDCHELDLCCIQCEVYRLYHRESGLEGHQVRDRYPEEEERFRAALRRNLLGSKKK